MKEIKEFLNELDKLRSDIHSLQYQQERTYQTLIDRIMINCSTDVHPIVLEHLKHTAWIRKIGYWVHDIKNGIFMGTRDLLQFLGTNPTQDTFTEEEFFAIIHKDDLPRILASYPEDMKAHEDRASAYRIINLHSELKYVISHFSTKYDKDDNPIQVNGIIFEIPQEEQETKQKFEQPINRVIRNNMGVGFWEYNPLDDTEYWSASLYDIIESNPEECPAQTSALEKLIAPDIMVQTITYIQEMNQINSDYDLVFKIKTYKGQNKYVFSQVHNLLDTQGKLVKRYGLIYDITRIESLLNTLPPK